MHVKHYPVPWSHSKRQMGGWIHSITDVMLWAPLWVMSVALQLMTGRQSSQLCVKDTGHFQHSIFLKEFNVHIQSKLL